MKRMLLLFAAVLSLATAGCQREKVIEEKKVLLEEEAFFLAADDLSLIAPEAQPLADMMRESRILISPDKTGFRTEGLESDDYEEDPGAPKVVLEIIETWDDKNYYYISVNYRNLTNKQGNRTIHTFEIDKLGRIVNTNSQVYYFRPYQQYIRRYRFSKWGLAVRWIFRIK